MDTQISTPRIRQIGDPILREESLMVEISELPNSNIDGLINRIQQILDGIKAISDENGNALSAPQVGTLLRVIVLRIDGQFCPMINPVITPNSEEMFEFAEECFSMYDRRGYVMRHADVQVSFIDTMGRPHSRRMLGEWAGLVQHEVDHLNGVLFIDHLASGKAITIDETFKNQPQRLQQVREMYDYMRG